MNIHIVCPFKRIELLPTLIKYLEPMNIIFHPVITPEEIFEVNRDWIRPLVVEINAYVIAYEKINKFIEQYPIIDEDYYGFMGDDDMYEPGFFDVIREQTAGILMYSLYRGDSIPECDPEKHPPIPIHMCCLDNVRVCNIGLLQYILKGSILRQTRFDTNHRWSDGGYAETLAARFPGEIKFLPNLYGFGNFFQPGRYTQKSFFIKSTWELPEIV